MDAWLWSILMLGGAGLLYLGAEWLVKGGARLAMRLGLSPLVVGLTVVAYGTSAPELVVGVQAGWTGHGQLALGNVLGSNIANLGLILGLTALLQPAPVHRALARREVPVLLFAQMLLGGLLLNGRLDRWEATLLVLLSLAYTTWMLRHARKQPKSTDLESLTPELEAVSSQDSLPKLLGLIAAGLLFLILGGHSLVQGASNLARMLGMSERLVGLTIVAVGTSLPELATTLTAAYKGHTDMAVGNIVGSNLFNILLCLGAAGLTGGIQTAPVLQNLDFGLMTAFTLLGLFLLRSERTLRRWEGGLLLAAYITYTVFTVTAG